VVDACLKLAAQNQQSDELPLREGKRRATRGPSTKAIDLIVISRTSAILRASAVHISTMFLEDWFNHQGFRIVVSGVA